MQKTKVLIKWIFLALSGVLIISGCKKEDSRIEEEQVKLQLYLQENGYNSIEPTSSGLYHVVIDQGSGEKPLMEDHVNVLFTGSLVDGTVFDTSDSILAKSIIDLYREGVLYGPAKFLLGTVGISGLKEGIALMNEGGKAKFIIPSNLGFGSIDYGVIPPYSTLIYEVELLDVIKDPAAHEQGLLDDYISANEIEVMPTPSGLYYIEQEAGEGDLPAGSDMVYIKFTGSLLDGRVFEKSVAETFSFPINTTEIIPGLIEGVKKMRKGGTARIIIPWDIGFGAKGQGIIPPYSTLVFDVELVNIQ